MQIGIDTIALIVMESLAVAFFLLTLLFVKQSRKIGSKMKRHKESGLLLEGEGESWSQKWVVKNIVMSRRRILHPSSLGATLMIFGTWILAGVFSFTALILLGTVGYAPLLVLVALAMVTDPEAYQAYRYVNAVVKVSINQLNKDDEDYMSIAKEALNRKTMRFLIIAIAFAFFGPFIPLVFESLTYTLAVYANILFKAYEISSRISVVLTLAILLLVPGLLLYFPEFFGRALFSMLKRLVRRIREPSSTS